MAKFHSPPNLRRNFAARYSPWMLIGVAAILALAITVLAARNAQRERAYMSQNLMDRADSLIWAIEAGTRTSMGMRSGAQNVQAMVEETAKQAGVVYLVVVDDQGNLIASSAKDALGESWRGAQAISGLAVADKSQWRNATLPDGREVFEVYRTFAPLPGFSRHMHHVEAPGRGFRGYSWRGPADASRGENALLIFIGLDIKPFEDALAEDFRNTLITGAIVGLLALGGFLSLFWAQHYRLSRRMLQDANAFASEIVTSMPSGLVATDEKGRITLVNDAASRLFGAPETDLEGRPLHALTEIPWDSIVAQLAAGAAVHEQERVFATGQGESVPVSLSASMIVNEEGLRLGYLFLIEDIRERKRAQEQLRRSERLSALGQMAARVAHEIRNPLSSIKGFARFFAERSPEGSGKEIAFTMMAEVDRLNRVVTELLDFARPSSLTLKPGDLGEVIERAMRLTRDDAGKKGIAASFAVPPDLPPVNMDFERLTQVFLNLFINAIQAMNQGGALSVAASRRGARVAVSVSDTGQGVAPDALPGIFAPYYTTKPTGTGLGLAIVQKILEEHGGEIKVESVPGQGTTFTLLFPEFSAA